MLLTFLLFVILFRSIKVSKIFSFVQNSKLLKSLAVILPFLAIGSEAVEAKGKSQASRPHAHKKFKALKARTAKARAAKASKIKANKAQKQISQKGKVHKLAKGFAKYIELTMNGRSKKKARKTPVSAKAKTAASKAKRVASAAKAKVASTPVKPPVAAQAAPVPVAHQQVPVAPVPAPVDPVQVVVAPVPAPVAPVQVAVAPAPAPVVPVQVAVAPVPAPVAPVQVAVAPVPAPVVPVQVVVAEEIAEKLPEPGTIPDSSVVRDILADELAALPAPLNAEVLNLPEPDAPTGAIPVEITDPARLAEIAALPAPLNAEVLNLPEPDAPTGAIPVEITDPARLAEIAALPAPLNAEVLNLPEPDAPTGAIPVEITDPARLAEIAALPAPLNAEVLNLPEPDAPTGAIPVEITDPARLAEIAALPAPLNAPTNEVASPVVATPITDVDLNDLEAVRNRVAELDNLVKTNSNLKVKSPMKLTRERMQLVSHLKQFEDEAKPVKQTAPQARSSEAPQDVVAELTQKLQAREEKKLLEASNSSAFENGEISAPQSPKKEQNGLIKTLSMAFDKASTNMQNNEESQDSTQSQEESQGSDGFSDDEEEKKGPNTQQPVTPESIEEDTSGLSYYEKHVIQKSKADIDQLKTATRELENKIALGKSDESLLKELLVARVKVAEFEPKFLDLNEDSKVNAGQLKTKIVDLMKKTLRNADVSPTLQQGRNVSRIDSPFLPKSRNVSNTGPTLEDLDTQTNELISRVSAQSVLGLREEEMCLEEILRIKQRLSLIGQKDDLEKSKVEELRTRLNGQVDVMVKEDVLFRMRESSSRPVTPVKHSNEENVNQSPLQALHSGLALQRKLAGGHATNTNDEEDEW